ncbi:MAG TPA: heme exporter protein CcmB [Alphaproteobacteria bacterium]|jgi:heme exporter protein B|nr:heme exporter protein CcmB [Alphaproteobacteria bacterium]
MSRFLLIVAREIRLAFRQGGGAGLALAFFVLAAVLFPLGVGPEPNMLSRIAGGVVFVTALLATMLSLERLFQADFEDGSLDLLALSPLPLEFVVLGKCVANWLLAGLPLLIAAPMLAILFHMNTEGLPALIAAMLLATPTLSLVGSIGAALTVGARRGGVLLSLLVLPLYVPVLIFAVGAVDAVLQDFTAQPQLLALSGLLLAALALAPWAAAGALRQALE